MHGSATNNSNKKASENLSGAFLLFALLVGVIAIRIILTYCTKNGKSPMMRAFFMALESFFWCLEQTPLRRVDTILPYEETYRFSVSVSL